MADRVTQVKEEGVKPEDKDGVRKPSDSRFHQQKLPAWQPLLTAGSVFPLFFIIGIIFVPIGAILLVTSNGIVEKVLDYTNCKKLGSTSYCSEEVTQPSYYLSYASCQCVEDFNLTEKITGPVLAYYALTNFYQNHRRYVKSRDDTQFAGDLSKKPNDDCDPYKERTVNSTHYWIAPCGAVANSLFNDTFQLFYVKNNVQIEVPWTKKGIAWYSDRHKKFKKISNFTGTIKPPSWPKTPSARDPDSFEGDEELIVWMRSAALSNFRKLHRKILHSTTNTTEFNDGLPAGKYKLVINYAYPVTAFAGTKSFILTSTSWMGGKNPSLGILYLIVGSIHIILGVVFTIVHVYSSKQSSVDLQTAAL